MWRRRPARTKCLLFKEKKKKRKQQNKNNYAAKVEAPMSYSLGFGCFLHLCSYSRLHFRDQGWGRDGHCSWSSIGGGIFYHLGYFGCHLKALDNSCAGLGNGQLGLFWRGRGSGAGLLLRGFWLSRSSGAGWLLCGFLAQQEQQCWMVALQVWLWQERQCRVVVQLACLKLEQRAGWHDEV